MLVAGSERKAGEGEDIGFTKTTIGLTNSNYFSINTANDGEIPT